MIDAVWLRALGPDRLAGLLQRRPDAVESPTPGSLTELAERLTAPWSVVQTLRRLDRPTLQVAEALAALGGSASKKDLNNLLGNPEQASLERALSTLHEHALLLLEPQPALLGAAANAWPNPLHLGVPLTQALEHRTVPELKALGTAISIATGTRKAEVLREVTAALSNHELVRALVAKAPRQIRDELLHSARTGELIEITSFGYHYGYPGRQRPKQPEATDLWGIERGLLVRADTADGLVLVAEVALALRGPDYTAPFEPDPPLVATVACHRAAVDSGGVAAISAFGNIVTALLDAAGQTPIAVLKAGGVGAREIKRLAKTTGTDERGVRLALTLGYHQNLWQFTPEGGKPTGNYDAWLAEAPAQRLAQLMRTMWTLPQIPLGEEGPWHPIDAGQQVAELRRGLVAEIPAGAAVADPAALTALVAWRFPYGIGDPEISGRFIQAIWSEAELTGIVSGGALTSAGRALLEDSDGLAGALASVGEAQSAARFQTDLTAVVTGLPAADLTRLLDTAADRVSRGVAASWRFSTASVRRALDAGHDAESLLDQLSKVANGGLPQPLVYLFHDVARQHGTIRVRAVTCCIRSEDTALLERLVADRGLRNLGLRLLAPTVLAGSLPLEQTLAALRSAAYAPIGEEASGAAIVEKRQTQRTKPANETSVTGRKLPAQHIPAEVATRLLAAPDSVQRPPSRTMAAIRPYARHLRQAELLMLTHAIETKSSLVIVYLNQSGNESVKEIDQIEFIGGSLYAWCHERQDSRVFQLSNILGVMPS